MASNSDFKQLPHKLLLIPGPIEVTDEVLFANAAPSVSHVSPDFIKIFGDAIRLTRGSGTLGWDQARPIIDILLTPNLTFYPKVSANLVEPGESALVLHTGYFGDSFSDWQAPLLLLCRATLQTYGARVDVLKANLGTVVEQPALEKALRQKKYKIVTFTHVDTSTGALDEYCRQCGGLKRIHIGVLSNAKLIAETVRRVSPETLVVADCVCSVGSEEIRFDEWDLDVVLTASQKGLGTPPGLSILVASQRAMKVYQTRASPITSYYASWKKWLPIMNAYETGTPAYFATPPVNLINAYLTSLQQLTNASPSLEERFRLHREASKLVKDAAADLGLKQIATEPSVAANGMTTLYYPHGLGASDIIPRFAQHGVVIAGGLLAEIKDKYFRIGHMGVSVVDTERGDTMDDFLSTIPGTAVLDGHYQPVMNQNTGHRYPYTSGFYGTEHVSGNTSSSYPDSSSQPGSGTSTYAARQSQANHPPGETDESRFKGFASDSQAGQPSQTQQALLGMQSSQIQRTPTRTIQIYAPDSRSHSRGSQAGEPATRALSGMQSSEGPKRTIQIYAPDSSSDLRGSRTGEPAQTQALPGIQSSQVQGTPKRPIQIYAPASSGHLPALEENGNDNASETEALQSSLPSTSFAGGFARLLNDLNISGSPDSSHALPTPHTSSLPDESISILPDGFPISDGRLTHSEHLYPSYLSHPQEDEEDEEGGNFCAALEAGEEHQVTYEVENKIKGPPVDSNPGPRFTAGPPSTSPEFSSGGPGGERIGRPRTPEYAASNLWPTNKISSWRPSRVSRNETRTRRRDAGPEDAGPSTRRLDSSDFTQARSHDRGATTSGVTYHTGRYESQPHRYYQGYPPIPRPSHPRPEFAAR
ncbi:hypothetical protein H0H93_003553 [Arthromyces matolae]|nr:hypothetical protein H0H93_003553 [Arthromyces matolae]